MGLDLPKQEEREIRGRIEGLLTAEQLQVLTMIERGLTPKEVAEATGLEVGHVYTIKSRAKKRLEGGGICPAWFRALRLKMQEGKRLRVPRPRNIEQELEARAEMEYADYLRLLERVPGLEKGIEKIIAGYFRSNRGLCAKHGYGPHDLRYLAALKIRTLKETDKHGRPLGAGYYLRAITTMLADFVKSLEKRMAVEEAYRNSLHNGNYYTPAKYDGYEGPNMLVLVDYGPEYFDDLDIWL